MLFLLLTYMNYTPFDQHERHTFVDRTVDNAIEKLKQLEVTQTLGNLAVDFRKQLQNSFVANFSNGRVDIPQSQDDIDRLPIFAFGEGDALVLSRSFDVQTSKQVANTVRTFSEWRPLEGLSGSEAYGLTFFPYEAEIPITIPELTEAMTGTSAHLFSAMDDLTGTFEKAPKQGFVVVKMRPSLMLRMHNGQRYAHADDVAHELTHVRQIEAKPIIPLHNQKSADMQSLREELEAYHVGSVLAFWRFREDLPSTDAENLDHGYVQLVVEKQRQEFGVDPLDPYRPSPILMKKLESIGLGAVFHSKIIYADMAQMFEAKGKIV